MTPPTRPDHAREIKYALGDARDLCDRLGLRTSRSSFQTQREGLIIRCPVHDEKTPSCSIQSKNGVVLWHCHGCKASGDALSLIAAVRGLSLRRDFREVLLVGAELAGLHGVAHELRSGETSPEPRPVPVRPAPEPERDYPPADVVRAFLAACGPVAKDPQVATYLTGRAIDPILVDADRLGYALPGEDPAAARLGGYRGRPWSETGHRLIVPVRSVLEPARSVRAWRVVEGESPKRLPPGGFKAAGLFMANPFADAWLGGTFTPARVLIAEGEPNFMTAATWRMGEPTAVIGIYSGSWTRELAARFRPGMQVLVFTDLDPAGERYAAEIRESLAPRGAFLSRWTGRAA